MLIVSGVELFRTNGRLKHYMWGLLLSLGLFIVGGLFMFHDQHEADVPPVLLLVQHRIFAILFRLLLLLKLYLSGQTKIFKPFSITWLLHFFIWLKIASLHKGN